MLNTNKQPRSSVTLRLHLLLFVLLSNRVQVQCSACEHPILYFFPSETSPYVFIPAATPLSPMPNLLSVL